MTTPPCPNCDAHHWIATIAYAAGEREREAPLDGGALTCSVCGHRYVPAADGALRDTDGDP